jgi:hypothetical protein
MRGGAVLILLAVTALGAYSIGRQDASVRVQAVPAASPSASFAKPLALASASIEVPATTTARSTSSLPVAAPPNAGPSQAPSDTKGKVEAVLTVAAVAALIVQASRDQYHAGGRPCACPDDSMRNGRACGGRSAYSRPGGAAPLCYPSDVTAAMIDSYRQRQASR